ncbi:MAG: hypothetical protein EG822_04695 [Deltaproteobacteria bacterium]|nr:hypothetical protein [Deltaproteobacteria bacterium]TLN02981.1 MAG: hypothetical protein FDZ73_09305 [bacterium]
MAQAQGFYWERQPAAEQIVLDLLADCRRQSAALALFEARLIRQTSGRLLDWVDHLLLRDSRQLSDKLTGLGFVVKPSSGQDVWQHPGTQLPRVVLSRRAELPETGLALRMENLSGFLQANGYQAEIEGEPFHPFRSARLKNETGIALLAVERRGSADFVPARVPAGYLHAYLSAAELWQTRPRFNDNEEQLWEDIFRRVDSMISLLDSGPAAQLVCQGERSYWLTRNFAGRLQQGRQDTLGLGIANEDHLTFRSSRRHFRKLVELFSRLGFTSRERFYAGKEAGWGAQIMENSAAGQILFLDVDLAPEEVAVDFSRQDLPEREQLGTVGLWCALHGDSIFGAGLHHLAARFDFDRLISDLAGHGVEYMVPFSDFPYLRQAFSVAERWGVDPDRLTKLVQEKRLSSEQAERFLVQGAVGSHLENIERREGYKGFNRKNVSAIILQTDPRMTA